MKANWTGGVSLALAVGLAAALLAGHHTGTAIGAAPDEGPAGRGSRYNIVAAAEHVLIVTDTKTNTLYFYRIEKDKELGTELKLRSSFDLNQVGKPILKPKTTKQDKGLPGGRSRYNIVAAAEHVLIVTDTKTNTLYFYRIEKDKELGTELKLRSSIDLNQVGKPILKPKTTKQDK